MSRKEAGCLIVRAGGRRVGLSLDQVVEVLLPGAVHPVPSVEGAVRGVTMIRGKILPLVHLGALLEGGNCPLERGEVAIVVELAGRRICLEVEEAESVLQEPGVSVPAGSSLSWAAALIRMGDGLVPLLDLPAVASRIVEATAA